MDGKSNCEPKVLLQTSAAAVVAGTNLCKQSFCVPQKPTALGRIALVVPRLDETLEIGD